MRKLSEIFRKSLPFLTSLFLITSTILGAGELTFYGQTDKNPLTYQPGEEIVFTIRLLEDGQPCGGKTIRWTRSGDDGNTETGKTVSDTDEPLVIRTSIDLPGFVWIKTVVLDESGEPVSGEAHEFNGGAGTKLDRLMSFPEPDDFDEFWQRQKTRLAEVPLKATLTEVDSEAEGVKCYDLRVDCIGVPVSGYFCMPETAAEKSLPATLVLQGYGVDSAGKENRLGKSGLALCINAHGIENGREKSYYKELFNTTLRGYGFPASSNANPETSYWNGVALRVMRALEFLKSRPEWDGENLRVVGGSQGGFQSILGAALDKDVNMCELYVPWFCDLSGPFEQQRNRSLFMPEWTPALGYYDGVNHAKRIKCPVTISAGLGDYICPPSGVVTLYNNIKSNVRLTFHQGQTHGYTMKDAPSYSIEKNR
jgi:cephalosporin-C deacetylase-like acetyl esterase